MFVDAWFTAARVTPNCRWSPWQTGMSDALLAWHLLLMVYTWSAAVLMGAYACGRQLLAANLSASGMWGVP